MRDVTLQTLKYQENTIFAALGGISLRDVADTPISKKLAVFCGVYLLFLVETDALGFFPYSLSKTRLTEMRFHSWPRLVGYPC
jgi:hypothetical protein